MKGDYIMNKNTEFRTRLYNECVSAADFADQAVMMAYAALGCSSELVFNRVLLVADLSCKAARECASILYADGNLSEDEWIVIEDIDNADSELEGLHNLVNEIMEEEMEDDMEYECV